MSSKDKLPSKNPRSIVFPWKFNLVLITSLYKAGAFQAKKTKLLKLLGRLKLGKETQLKNLKTSNDYIINQYRSTNGGWVTTTVTNNDNNKIVNNDNDK